MEKHVYDFAEGNSSMLDLLGGKGANLAEMSNLGLPVPPGFTITTEACRAFLTTGSVPSSLLQEVSEHLARLEQDIGRRLGDPNDPLLVSVRSGGKFSMPGMMDTVLDVGLNDASVEGLAKQLGDERFAWDSYRRLVQMFGKTVMGVDGGLFESALSELKQAQGASSDLDLGVDDLRDLVSTYRDIVYQETGCPFPVSPRQQLDLAIAAVFRSWTGERARIYAGKSASPMTWVRRSRW
jgi:pyruvate,orthophosphate dikinase